jgi:hypothetical protein
MRLVAVARSLADSANNSLLALSLLPSREQSAHRGRGIPSLHNRTHDSERGQAASRKVAKSDAVAELGQDAFRTENLAQLNLRFGATWLIISAGTVIARRSGATGKSGARDHREHEIRRLTNRRSALGHDPETRE